LNSAQTYWQDATLIAISELSRWTNCSGVLLFEPMQRLTMIQNISDDTTFDVYDDDRGFKQMLWDYIKSIRDTDHWSSIHSESMTMTDSGAALLQYADWTIAQSTFMVNQLELLFELLDSGKFHFVFGTPYVSFTVAQMTSISSQRNVSFVYERASNEQEIFADYSLFANFPLPIESFPQPKSNVQYNAAKHSLVFLAAPLSTNDEVAAKQLPLNWILPAIDMYLSPQRIYHAMQTFQNGFAMRPVGFLSGQSVDVEARQRWVNYTVEVMNALNIKTAVVQDNNFINTTYALLLKQVDALITLPATRSPVIDWFRDQIPIISPRYMLNNNDTALDLATELNNSEMSNDCSLIYIDRMTVDDIQRF
jgi:hypothetical protein